MKSQIIAGIFLILFVLSVSVVADITKISPGGTVFIGEEQIDISAAGIGPGGQIAWWAPGTSTVESPADVVTVSNPSRFSALSSSFSGREGIWYSLADKAPVIKIKQPKISVRISDTTSDFDATGKWLPRGHLASFQIETNLHEIGNRDGAGGAPVDIIIQSPGGSEYSAVSGPAGLFSLTNIRVSSSSYDTGEVWNTGDADSGVYHIRAECTANRINSNNPGPGAAVSETISVQIQGVNPLSSGGSKSTQIEVGDKEDTYEIPEMISPSPSPSISVPSPVQTKPIPPATPVVTASPQVIVTEEPVQPSPIPSLTPQQLPPVSVAPATPASPFPSASPTTPLSGCLVILAIIGVAIRVSR